MGEPQTKRDGGSGYWRIRIALEVLKTAIWTGFQWVRHGGPFGPF
ncbi:hypothetical protein [Actinomadura sp. 6N118]